MPDVRSPMDSSLRSVGSAVHEGKSQGYTQPDSGTPSSAYERGVLEWVRLALMEGAAAIKVEDQEEDVDENKRIVMGDYSGPDASGALGEAYSKSTMARLGKNVEDLSAAMTDFKLTGSYRTHNKMFEGQGELLDKLFKAWWYEQDIDLKLGLLVKQAFTCRTAYAHVVFNPTLHNGLGDCDLLIKDYRDVIPIRPNSRISIQDSLGVIVKSRNTVNWVRARFGDRALNVQPRTSTQSLFSKVGQALRKVSVMDQLQGTTAQEDLSVPTYDHYEIYIKDESVNDGSEAVWVGMKPADDDPYGYWVQPNSPLYPRGRLIVVANLDTILYDGGNPYWHGMFPVIKFTPNPWPWSLLGKSVLADSKSAQFEAIRIARGISDSVQKALNPGAIVDGNAVPRRYMEELDTREPGWKLFTNPFGAQGVELEKPPVLPDYVIARYNELNAEIDHVMGILDMRSLAQLRLSTLSDVETLMESVGPSVRDRGRALEVFLRELAEMMKGNFFQFWDKTRRIQVLGAEGLDIEDFKFDPDSLVPAFSLESADGDEKDTLSKFYAPREGDGAPILRPRSERAQAHVKSFHYYITPNSLLQLAKTQMRLIYLQFFKMGVLDAITLLEAFDVPNIPRIIERMQAAQEIGMVGAVSAAGRKATDQTLPGVALKDGGTRFTMPTSR